MKKKGSMRALRNTSVTILMKNLDIMMTWLNSQQKKKSSNILKIGE